MENETEKMREGRHALERLSASDPAAQANMLRWAAATRIMLTGRRGDADEPPLIGSGFRLMGDSVQLPAALTREDGADRIYIAFDVDDAAGPAIGLGLFRKDDDQVSCYGLCRLWSPAGDSRALLVPAMDGSLGYFAHKSGVRLRRSQTPPPGDLLAGFRRSEARMAKLLASPELRAIKGGGFLHLVTTEGGELHRQTTRLAA